MDPIRNSFLSGKLSLKPQIIKSILSIGFVRRVSVGVGIGVASASNSIVTSLMSRISGVHGHIIHWRPSAASIATGIGEYSVELVVPSFAKKTRSGGTTS